jgi:hypothetical protein
MIRASSLLKGFVLALIFSVFLQASLASANGGTYIISNKTQLAAIGIGGEVGTPLSGEYVVTQSFAVDAAAGNTYIAGTFTGTFDGGGNSISGLTRPLFDVIGVADDIAVIIDLILASDAGVSGDGALANTLNLGSEIDNVSFAGDVTGTADVGGLVGYSYGAITNSSATGVVTGDSYVGGLVGSQEESSTITNSNANGAVYGDYAVGGLVGRSRSEITNSYATSAVDGANVVGGLVGESTLTSTITNSSYATGDVIGSGTYIGGLVGYLAGAIDNSYATGDVTGNDNVGGLVGVSQGTITNSLYATGDVTGSGEYIGGLVGWLEAGAIISNSYAKTGTVYGTNNVGGLVGSSAGAITNSQATGVVMGNNNVGGLVGWESIGTVTNSYAAGEVVGTFYVGGLVGNSSASIINSYATGVVIGNSFVGGLVGYLVSDEEDIGTISNSYATGDVIGVDSVGSLVGFTDLNIIIENSSGYFEATINGETVEDPYLGVEPLPYILDIINTLLGEGFPPAFEVNTSINSGLPYLTSLELSYDVVEEDTEETPSFSLRSFYTQAAKSLDKALTSYGFKSNFSSHPTLGFQALEQNQSKLPAVIQLFEVSEYQNSNILLNKEDGLQLSISSYYKEPVEIWTQGSNGEYLYLGLVEFDKDGKAILPALKFDTASTYQLLMIKAADKVSEKPNLEAKLGQITINVF